MMYNRYIPQSNGIYKKHTIEIPDRIPQSDCHTPEKEPQPDQCCHKTMPPMTRGNLDLGDLLLLCIVILLLLESEEDIIPILIAVAVFVFTQ